MIFLKNYFVTTTQETDFIPIIHDVRFAIKEAQIPEGLATITLPAADAGLVICTEKPATAPAELQVSSLSIPFRNNELLLEPKQMIYLIDKSQTAKRREFFVQVLGEKPQAPQQQRGRARR